MTAYGNDLVGAPSEIGLDAAKIRENKLLEEIYREFYSLVLREIPSSQFPRVLELGSGGGFLRELEPRIITSECIAVPGIHRVVDACAIADAFADGDLDAICAVNVFHHLPDVSGFLRGASIVLRPAGRIVLIEPWFTPIGQWFHRLIHHEPHINDPADWRLLGEGRMLAANTRLPTSVFRDSDERFLRDFPHLRITKREPFHKWLYLLSGGLRLNTHVPRNLARGLVAWDKRISLGNRFLGIFALIVVERI
jgi:SAM-dependent methyltransferase